MRLIRTLATTAIAAIFAIVTAQAQPVVDQDGDMGLGTLEPHPSALLDMVSTTKGFVGPRMTEVQRDAIVNPTEGLIIYNLDATEYQYFDGFVWIPIGLTAGAFWELDGNAIASEYTGIGPSPAEQFLGTTTADDLSIVTFMNQNIDFWTNNVERFSVTAGGDIVPTNNNDISLGSDANRFADVFVNGASVHIGDAIGAEMELGYGGSVGSINVDGADPEVLIDAGTGLFLLDANGDGTENFAVFAGFLGGFDVDDDNNAEFLFGPAVGSMNFNPTSDGTAEVLIDNATGNVTMTEDLNVNGSADIDTDLNVDGVITAAGAGHTLGTAAVDASVLSILGDPFNVGNYELFVDGDAQITGLLNLAAMTPGSVIFIDGAGNLAEDNPNFFWDGAATELGLGTNATSARLDVVGDNTNPAIEATNNGVIGIESTVDGGSGLILSSYPAVQGDGNGETGVAGTSDLGVGVYGASSNNHGVNGLSLTGSAAGVFGRNDQAGGDAVRGVSFGSGTGVNGQSSSGHAAEFETTGGAANTVEINDASTGDALEINANAGSVGIDLNGGELDGDDQGNALGDGSANQQLTVRGTADAVIGNTLGGNPTVWDLVTEGDLVATGIIKAGGSVWVDGSTPGNHQVVANDQFNVGTLGTDDLTVSTNSTNAVVVDGTTQDVNILNDLDVDGDLNADGATTLDETTIDGTLDQIGGAQVTFSGNVDADNGLDVSGADLNVATNANISGNLQVLGTSDLRGPIFDGAGPLQLVDGTGIELTGPTTLNGSFTQSGGTNIFNGNATFNGTTNTVNGTTFNVNAVTTNINSLGLNVNGIVTNLNAISTNVTGQLNATGGGNLAGTFTGNPTFSGNPAFTGTPTFSNIDVNGGNIDATTIGGTTPANGTFNLLTANGTFDANAAGNEIGNGANAEQLEVNGVDGGAVEVDINGDVDISGNLTVGTFSFALGADLDMNGFDLVDNTDNIVTVDDGFSVTGATTLASLTVTTTSNFTGLATFATNSTFNGMPTFNAASQFNAASTWGGPGAPTTTVAQGNIDVEGTVAGTPALEAENTAANGIAIQVPAGGGRTILSYGAGGAVAIPGDVTVWSATAAPTAMPAGATNGQVLYVYNNTGGVMAMPGLLAAIPIGQMRTYVYAAGAWRESI